MNNAKVVFVSPTTSLVDAARIMLANRLSGLPVLGSDGRLVGIITKDDIGRGIFAISARR
jgi:CBS domain-containing protein